MKLETLDRRTNLPTVTETRNPNPFRALPRKIAETIAALDAARKFLVRYQDFSDRYVTAVRCWKCGRLICAYQPVLRQREGRDKTRGEVTVLTTLDGVQMAVGNLLPYNHYREGLFAYKTADGRDAQFSYLHCADCHIKDEHGEALLACLLGQFDHRRDHLKPYLEVVSDDAWAQYMFGWSGVTLVGKTGKSLGPADLMKGKI